ncbi:hypothetical protein TL16_g05340 [Triparma laevis f. inornata]|uniref:guanylate kinase n=1 Tax=Triparma laevis f. inornata TaxID=1714386 RepID=A0A9W7AGH8_9STRA|nr:hypothetical protein TL16_g05340 [Triparma laevis f. inornata]
MIICGPSGVGKSSLLSKTLFSNSSLLLPPPFSFSTSHTTRLPRMGETNGVEYNFVLPDFFTQNPSLFLETAEVHGNYYGTTFKAVNDVREQNQICVLDLDVQGVKTLKSGITSLQTPTSTNFFSMFLNSKFIFITPPKFSTLENRLRNRNTETEETLKTRLQNAQSEIDYGTSGVFDEIIVNDDVERAAENLASVLERFYPDQRLERRR